MDKKLYHEVSETLGGFSLEQIIPVAFTLLIEKGVLTKEELEKIFYKPPVTHNQEAKKKWYEW